MVQSFELENIEKYKKVYQANSITFLPPKESKVYAHVTLWERIKLVENHLTSNDTILDLCCGSGEHLFYLSQLVNHGIGIDISSQFIQRAKDNQKQLHASNIELILGNVRHLPFSSNMYNVVYSFSSLYHIPAVEQVILEISRVLKTKGICVLDFGNVFSLNTIVCKAYPNLARPYHISVEQMLSIFNKANLSIITHKAFQITPMWSKRPLWLYPLLSDIWVKLMSKKIKGKMLDEWLSNLSLLKYFAFRHVFVCEKR